SPSRASRATTTRSRPRHPSGARSPRARTRSPSARSPSSPRRSPRAARSDTLTAVPKESTASTHPVTLFTGQWADLPLDEVARLAASWSYDGLEVACGAHLNIARAKADDAYLAELRGVLDAHGMKLFAISNHLSGQAVCDDPI